MAGWGAMSRREVGEGCSWEGESTQGKGEGDNLGAPQRRPECAHIWSSRGGWRGKWREQGGTTSVSQLGRVVCVCGGGEDL